MPGPRGADRLLLVAAQVHRLPTPGVGFPEPEDAAALLVEEPFSRELVDGVCALGRKIQLKQGVRHQLTVGEVLVHGGADLDVANEVGAETGDVHAITSYVRTL